mmetsp:Transcript_25737/g.64732  ORF Transcript_25737/g.64732 Transcript_25737/m.64732 type:complete len:614 (+) Transcript_25737:313-2154(+)
MYSDFKGKAIEFVKLAVEEDQAENYEKAYELYCKALDHFGAHLKYDKNPRSKEVITAKFKEYLQRAEAIKQMLDNVDSTANSQAKGTGAGATATKAKPKGQGVNEDADLEKLKNSLGGVILEEKPNVKWDDVAGLEGAKDALKEAVILPIQFPQFFTGARKPWSGILLYGPPGTGKSYLAKAIATEADSTFFSVSSSDLVSKWMGESEKLVSQLFAMARERAPSIVFIDEIDAVAKGRDSRLRSVGNDEREQTLNQLLTELDGFDSDKENLVICIAATNRAEVLDKALLRPGRFDRRVAVERPDKIGRQQILTVHLNRRDLPLEEDVTVETIASATTGFTGADLANLVNEAALLAGRDNKHKVSLADFDSAVLRTIAGVEKKRSILQGKDKGVVAKHEVGHAIVGAAACKLLPDLPMVERMSIVPRSGGALGFTYSPQKEDRALIFDTELRAQLAILLGGRAAEQYFCGQISTGAADDIQRATSMAQMAVSEWGLSTAVGPLNIGALGGSGDQVLLRDNSGQLASLVEHEVRALVEGALEVAMEVVSTNSKTMFGLSGELEEVERLEGDKLQSYLAQVEVPAKLRDFVLQGKIPPKRLSLTIHTPHIEVDLAL